MLPLNRKHCPHTKYTEKIIFFGSGQFLRGFICPQIQQLNVQTGFDAGIICTKRESSAQTLNRQDGLFYVLNSETDAAGTSTISPMLIDCVTREISLKEDFSCLLAYAKNFDIKWIFSNTTEAGIVDIPEDRFHDHPPRSFPAKLVHLLYQRYCASQGNYQYGFIILPCELIDNNGYTLEKIVLHIAKRWGLTNDFCNWVQQANLFCNTLVDQIVPGKPKEKAILDKLPFQDDFSVMTETFYLFVIHPPAEKKDFLRQQLCLDQLKTPLNIVITDDLKPYQQQKVALLNGTHTALVPIAYLSGIDTVDQAMQHMTIKKFIEHLMLKEIVPVLEQDITKSQYFAHSVMTRFQNTQLKHHLLNISLNGMSKFKTRNLPVLLSYHQKFQCLPSYLCFSLAALIVFYRQTRTIQNHLEHFVIQDEPSWLTFFDTQWSLFDQHDTSLNLIVDRTLSQQTFWGQDLTQIPQLSYLITQTIQTILQQGMTQALKQLLSSTPSLSLKVNHALSDNYSTLCQTNSS